MSNRQEKESPKIGSLALSDRLYRYGNGIDLQPKNLPRNRSFQYEDACFTQISAKGPKGSALFIGPHLIDEVLSHGMGNLSRPDTIRFSTFEELWRLTNLFEFKFGRRLAPRRKVTGFSVLLKKMRKDTSRLRILLQSALPNTVIPDKIVIPPDEEIGITFISPNLRNGTIFFQDVPPFKLDHRRIPAA